MKNSSSQSSISELTALIREFAETRDWQQFHTARNLVLALVGETGELAAEFQWVSDQSVDDLLRDTAKRDAVGSELADVFIYLLRLAEVIEVDLVAELKKKLAINEERYPVARAKGSAAKYTEYE